MFGEDSDETLPSMEAESMQFLCVSLFLFVCSSPVSFIVVAISFIWLFMMVIHADLGAGVES